LLVRWIAWLIIATAWPAPSTAQESGALRPCLLSEHAATQVLTDCTAELSRQGGWLHTRIALQWPGTGDAQRILALGMPDPAAMQLRQWHGLAQPTSTPGELLLSIQADSPASQRPAQSLQLAVPLRLHPGLNLLELRGQLRGNPLHMPSAQLYSAAAWQDWNSRHTLIAGMLLGLLLTLLVSLGLSYSLGRDRSYLAYAALTLCYVLGTLQLQGYLQTYLQAFFSPLAPAWNQRVLPSLVILGGLCQGAFALSFLQLSQRQPRGTWVLLWLMALLALLPWVQPPALADQLLLPLMSWYLLTILALAAKAVRMRQPGAKWYGLGALAFALCSVLLFGLAGNGLNPFPSIYLFDYPRLGYLLEMGCFCAAQVQRLLDMVRQRQTMRQRQLEDTQALLHSSQALQQAQAEVSMSRLLLASTSHDLAQPLAALRMTVGALRNQAQPDPAHYRQLDELLSHAQALLRSVLDQARHQHHQAEQTQSLMLGELFAQVVLRHQASAQAKGLRLSWVDSAQALHAPALVLHRLLDNLLSNAVRYTPRGRIVLGLRRRPGMLELQVLDTGLGLGAGQLAALQQPFQQVNTQAAQGHGLGLYIVRSLCHECGYTLHVRSELGRGSCFAIGLPQPGGHNLR
jgi:signal transduction histidine kinase